MGKTYHVIVAGAKRAGKTCVLQQLALHNNITLQPYMATVEDTYTVPMAGNSRDMLLLHDTAGLAPDASLDMLLRRCHIQSADAFVLVVDVGDAASFAACCLIKKHIDKCYAKEKKEMPVVVLANSNVTKTRQVSCENILAWAHREKVTLHEVNAADRSTLTEPILNLAHRLSHPQKESRFLQLSKKSKQEKMSGAAILMDI